MIEENILNRNRKVYILYEGNQSFIFSVKTNSKTSETSSIGKNILFFDNKIILTEITLPDSDYLFKEDIEFINKTEAIFELKCEIIFIKYEYKSVLYHFNLKDQYSNYFMFGLKFQKNDSNHFIKDPPGKPLDNNSEELLYYLKFILKKYLGKVKKSLTDGTVEKINFLNNDTITLLNDLILLYKENLIKKKKFYYSEGFTCLPFFFR